MMRSRRGLPFTLSRMGMYRPVLAMAAVLTLITAALIATLAAFAIQALVEDKVLVRAGDDGERKGAQEWQRLMCRIHIRPEGWPNWVRKRRGRAVPTATTR